MANSRIEDFFGPAASYADRAADVVEARIRDAKTTADALRITALSALAALGNAKFSITEPPPVPPTVTNMDTSPTRPSSPQQRSFGSITTPVAREAPALADASVDDVTIPEFVPSIDSLVIPDAPAVTVFSKPEVPVPDSITLPTAPTENIPELSGLVALDIPTYRFPTLPVFDSVAPTFTASPVSAVMSWAEPTYAPTIIDDSVSAIQRIFAGGTGLPPAVERALFERMGDREDVLVAKAVSEAMDDFSSRGFQNPPGMLASRIDAIRQEAMLKKQGAHRDLTIKFAEWEIENFRLAIQQGIAAEGVYANIWLNGVQRTFEAQKFQIEASIQVYNAQVSLFNAQMFGYQTAANVYKTKLDGALAELEGYKAQIEGERAKADINKVLVDAYEAKVRAILGTVEIYKAKMEGAKVQSDIARQKIEIYRAQVEAYATEVNADKLRFDAYKSRIDGESAKAGILEAESRAYAARVEGTKAGVEAQKARAEVVIENNKAAIQAFVAQVESDKARMQYELSAIQSAVAGFEADVRRFSAEAGQNAEYARVDIAEFETNTRTQIAYYQAAVQQYTLRTEQMLREASLTLESMKSVAQVAATLAAGAMAGINAGATLGGQANLNASGALQGQDQFSIQYNVSSEGAPPLIG